MRRRARATSPSAAPARGKFPYFNRELSWLAFNRRVLDVARAPDTPLLERLKFLAIVSSNLDEFFEIRVAGLIQQVDSGIDEISPDGLSPREQLRRIHSVVASLVDDQNGIWANEVVPALEREGIRFKTAAEFNAAELKWAKRYFDAEVFPVLTPLAIDPSHPFPQIANKTQTLAVAIDYPDTPEPERHLALVTIPRVLPRVVRLGAGHPEDRTFVFIGEIIRLFVGSLFTGCRVTSAKIFRLTRNSDLYIDEEEAENLLKTIESELRNLRRGAPVRLEVEDGIDEHLFKDLLDHIALPNEYTFRVPGPINLARLMSVYEAVDRPDLKFPPFAPARPVELLPGQSIFERIAAGDILLHHPYETFDTVVEFIQAAARDPQVCAIKQTLYRTSGDSPIVKALIEAARGGKQVTALIELKARFDEANNIQWARQMEEAGVHVVYGVVGLKVHAKACLVVRAERRGLRRYVHLGTGNYNPRTARLYTDFSLLTAHAEITREVAVLFNSLTSFARAPRLRHLLVAPHSLRGELIARIEREARHAAAGRPGRILAQINSVIDRGVIDALYAASRAGVQIDLVVRGICGVVPGLPGLSDNIRVRSIVGRFLEHVRVYYFANDGRDELFLASADWMPRNLFRRVEIAFPILDPALRARILDDYLPVLLADTRDARELRATGAYEPAARAGRARHDVRAQDTFVARATTVR